MLLIMNYCWTFSRVSICCVAEEEEDVVGDCKM